MSYILTFIDACDKFHIVKEIEKLGDEYPAIEAKWRELYPRRKIFFYRSWGDLDKEGITYDVGSHTEFFKLTKKEN